jgi:hypothetical protein
MKNSICLNTPVSDVCINVTEKTANLILLVIGLGMVYLSLSRLSK